VSTILAGVGGTIGVLVGGSSRFGATVCFAFDGARACSARDGPGVGESYRERSVNRGLRRRGFL